jgi:hypothetical protein
LKGEVKKMAGFANRVKKLKRIDGETSKKDRHFKAGDVIRFIPSHTPDDRAAKWGVGVVIDGKGPIFRALWVRDGIIRENDARMARFQLLDVEPVEDIGEYADHVEADDIVSFVGHAVVLSRTPEETEEPEPAPQ